MKNAPMDWSNQYRKDLKPLMNSAFLHVRVLVIVLTSSLLSACQGPQDKGTLPTNYYLNNQTTQTVVAESRAVGSEEFSVSEAVEAGTTETFYLTWGDGCQAYTLAEINIYTADADRTLLKTVTDSSEVRKEGCVFYIDLK